MPRPDPYCAFRFRVEISRLQLGGFQSISGLERQCQIEPYREGGVNDFEHQLITLSNYPPLVLKRGLFDNSIWDWHQDVIDGVVERETIAVILLSDSGEDVWRWVCIDAYPAKWSGAELDAGSSNIATESIDFVHHGLIRQ